VLLPERKQVFREEEGGVARRDVIAHLETIENGMPIDRPIVVYDRDFGQSDVDLSDYTVAPDGRILLIETSERGAKATHVNVMLNWYEPLLKSTK